MASAMVTTSVTSFADDAELALSNLSEGNAEEELPIYAYSSENISVNTDLSNMNAANAADVDRIVYSDVLPYSGSITFDGTLRYVSTPVLEANGKYPEQLYLSVINIDKNVEGNEMVYIKLYVHFVGDDGYSLANHGYTDYTEGVMYRPLYICPEGIEKIDSFYIEFWDAEYSSDLFDYLIYIC